MENVTTTLAYFFLFITVILLWAPKYKKIPAWWAGLILAIIFGFFSHRLHFLALIPVSLLMLSAYLLRHDQLTILTRVLVAIVLFVIGVGLEAHLFPGFNNLRVINHVQYSPDAIPFTLYLNFDKTLVGIVILGFLHTLIATKEEWLILFKATLPRACIVIIVVACLSFILQFVRFDPKFPLSFFIWAITNLLFVCVAEEGFFRGFIQKYLCLLLKRVKWRNLIAVLIASILFGLAHYKGGTKYMILASVAGLGYGWVYFKTKRIEASIVTHFSLNAIHFLFFTYPALAIAFR